MGDEVGHQGRARISHPAQAALGHYLEAVAHLVQAGDAHQGDGHHQHLWLRGEDAGEGAGEQFERQRAEAADGAPQGQGHLAGQGGGVLIPAAYLVPHADTGGDG